MDRRTFLKSLAAVPAAAAVPGWLQPLPVLALGDIMRMRKVLLDELIDNYVVMVHPSAWFDIRRLRALELWRDEYRAWRKARRGGTATETLEELMRRVKASLEAPDVAEMRDDLQDAMRLGEFGSYSGMCFIESERVA